MMEYEIFKGVVEEKFKEFLPEKYKDAQVEIRSVDKVNRTLDGLSIRINEPGMHISPTIYVNQMYEDYVATENLNATLTRAAEGFLKAVEEQNRFNVDEITNPETAKDKIGENSYYSYYTSQIEEQLENNGSITLIPGSIVSAKVINTNPTMAQQMKNFMYKVVGNDTALIVSSKAGMVQ